MTRHFFAVISFLFLTLGASSAFACKCERSIKPIKGSKMIFWGTVRQITPRGSQDKVKFDIKEYYKGEEKPDVSVYANRFEHDCGFRFEMGKNYMVYGYDFYPRGVATGLCWGTYETTEETPDPDEWKKVSPKAKEPSKFLAEMRKLAKKIVPPCGRKHRVRDAGFTMILSPNGDPIRPPRPEKIRDRIDNFQQCVSESLQAAPKLPHYNRSIRLVGWYQAEVKRLRVMVDELECGEGCPDWATRTKADLQNLSDPEPESKSAREVESERGQCIENGLEAVGPESFGTNSHKKRRNRMLADCVGVRGEFAQAAPYYESVDNPGILAALKWAAANVKAEGPQFPIGKGKNEFPKKWVKKGSKNASGDYRILRSHFIADPDWARSPVYLEAFAESVLADKEAPSGMRDFAALAYQRAALLKPEASEAYNALADKASKSKAAKALRAEYVAAYEKLHAPPVEEALVEEEVVEEETMEEGPAEVESEGQNPMLLIVAGVLIVVAVGGIATIMKRRR